MDGFIIRKGRENDVIILYHKIFLENIFIKGDFIGYWVYFNVKEFYKYFLEILLYLF